MKRLFRDLLLNSIVVRVIRGVECGGDSASGRTVRKEL
jgi:hypothetical protein